MSHPSHTSITDYKQPVSIENEVHIDSVLPLHQVASILGGVSVNTIRNWVAQGHLPPPVTIGPRLRGWRRSVIEAYIRSLSESEVSA